MVAPFSRWRLWIQQWTRGGKGEGQGEKLRLGRPGTFSTLITGYLSVLTYLLTACLLYSTTTDSDDLGHLARFDRPVAVDVVHLERPLELLFRLAGRRDVDRL